MRAYRGRLSGPLVDRIDLHVMLPPVDVASLRAHAHGESSQAVRDRVVRAREIQQDRQRSGETSARANALLSARDLERVALPDRAGWHLVSAAVERLGLSVRAYTKILRTSRTIADLAGATAVTAAHVAEAIQLRILDRRSS